MKMYKVLDTKINREFCKSVTGAENLIGQTLQGDVIGEYVKLETGHSLLLTDVEEVEVITYEYVNVIRKIQAYAVVNVEDIQRVSEIKVKNAIAKEAVKYFDEVALGYEKEYIKMIKKSVYNGCYVKRDGFKQIQVKGNFLKSAVKTETIDIIIKDNYNYKLVQVQAQKFNNNGIYFVKENNRYRVYKDMILLFDCKSKKEIENKLNEYSDKINHYINDRLVEAGFKAPNTKEQLEKYSNRLKEEIEFKENRINRLKNKGSHEELLQQTINELNALRDELKLVSNDNNKEINNINDNNSVLEDVKNNITIDNKIKINNTKIKIYDSMINRLFNNRDALKIEIDRNNIRYNNRENNLIKQLINIDCKLDSLELKIDVLRDDINRLKNIKYKLYVKTLKADYGTNKYKIIDRDNNSIIYSNNIDKYINDFNYNIFVLIKNAEYPKQIYNNNRKQHKHYFCDTISYLKDSLKVIFYDKNDTELNINKYYHIDRNNNILLIDETLKKDRIKVHYMKCIVGQFISVNYKSVNKMSDELYNKTMIAFKDNKTITDLLYDEYNKHKEYIKNYKSPTFEETKKTYIMQYNKTINKFKDLKKVAENLKYYSELYKDNIYKFYRDYNTNKINWNNYLYNYNELQKLKTLDNKEYKFEQPKEVVYTKNYRK